MFLSKTVIAVNNLDLIASTDSSSTAPVAAAELYTTFNPTTVKSAGTRLLLLDSVGDINSIEGPAAWLNDNGTNFIAGANDIVEWSGSEWTIVFDADNSEDTTYTTNLNTNTQYRYNDGSWLLSIDGEYPVGTWRIQLDT